MIGGISGYGFSYGYYHYAYSAQRNDKAAQTARQDQVKGVQRFGGMVTAQRAANPELPVQPVKAAVPVSADTAGAGLGLDLRLGADPVEMAVRMRIKYAGDEGQGAQSQAAGLELPGQKEASDQTEPSGRAGIEGILKTVEEGECQTCKERKYQDGSDDAGVSFKTPSHIDPDMAASAVRGHEQEHVVREQAAAGREGRKVVSQTVSLHTDICPECGRVYVSGGTTRTTTAADREPQEQVQRQEQARQVRAPFSAVA